MESNDAPVISSTTAGVTTVLLNRPDASNALNREMIAQLTHVLRTHASDGTRVIVLSHTGTTFCAGADLKESAAATSAAELPAAALPELFHTIDTLGVPVIALARGAVRGGGMGLLAAADIAICADTVRMAFSEVKLGVVPAVIAPLIERRLSMAIMRRLFLTGESFTAAQAQQWGFIDHTGTSENLDVILKEAISNLLSGGPVAQAGIKDLTSNPELLIRLHRAAATTASYFLSDEGQAGVSAFTQKRTAPWVSKDPQ